MQSAPIRLSNGVLTAVLALVIPIQAIAAQPSLQVETESPLVQTRIEEWHWRDMAF